MSIAAALTAAASAAAAVPVAPAAAAVSARVSRSALYCSNWLKWIRCQSACRLQTNYFGIGFLLIFKITHRHKYLLGLSSFWVSSGVFPLPWPPARSVPAGKHFQYAYLSFRARIGGKTAESGHDCSQCRLFCLFFTAFAARCISGRCRCRYFFHPVLRNHSDRTWRCGATIAVALSRQQIKIMASIRRIIGHLETISDSVSPLKTRIFSGCKKCPSVLALVPAGRFLRSSASASKCSA